MPASPPAPTRPPDVTVLVAAYNAAEFIDRAIASALSQTDVTLEVLVVDDGSTDTTRERVAAMATQDGRVRLVTLPRNGGPSRARNAGIEAASGKWIAVLDADDALVPGRLAHLLAFAAAEQADIVADNFVYYSVSLNTNSAPALHLERPATPIDCRSFVAGARPFTRDADYGLLKPMFRRDFLLANELRYPADVRHGEDFLLIYEALLRGARYVVSRTVGYVYTSRDSGRSRTIADYDGQARIARELAAAQKAESRPWLAALLRQRAAALSRLSTQRRVEATWRDRDYATLAWLVLTRIGVAKEVLRKVRAKAL